MMCSATCEHFKRQMENKNIILPLELDHSVLGKVIDFIYTGQITNLTQTMGREILILSKAGILPLIYI